MAAPLCRLAKKKKTGKKKKTKSEEAAVPTSSLATQAGPPDAEEGNRSSDRAREKESGPDAIPEPSTEASALSQLGLCIPEMKDTSMERVGRSLSKVIDSLDRHLDASAPAAGSGWSHPLDSPDQSFRTDSPGEALSSEGPPSGGFSEGLSAPMDFYRFTVESPNTPAASGGHHDPAGDGQSPHVPGGPEGAEQEEEGGREEDIGPAVANSPKEEEDVAETAGVEALHSRLKGDQKSHSPSSAEDSGVEEGQGSPSEGAHPSEFR